VFLCDRSTDGKDTEIDERPEDPDSGKEDGKLRKREDAPKEGPLKFMSFKDEEIKGDNFGVLRLEWRTKFACEDAVNAPRDSSAGWGFFTWMVIV